MLGHGRLRREPARDPGSARSSVVIRTRAVCIAMPTDGSGRFRYRRVVR